MSGPNVQMRTSVDWKKSLFWAHAVAENMTASSMDSKIFFMVVKLLYCFRNVLPIDAPPVLPVVAVHDDKGRADVVPVCEFDGVLSTEEDPAHLALFLHACASYEADVIKVPLKLAKGLVLGVDVFGYRFRSHGAIYGGGFERLRYGTKKRRALGSRLIFFPWRQKQIELFLSLQCRS